MWVWVLIAARFRWVVWFDLGVLLVGVRCLWCDVFLGCLRSWWLCWVVCVC